jgi:molecular chaperone HtpG
MDPSRIYIPEALDQKLGQYGPAVRLTLEAFDKAVLSDRPLFFPEYSDHGPDHISEVLATSEFLMGASIKLLNERDAAVLVLAVLLHDIGMHLSPDGFLQLAASKSPGDRDFEDRPWSELWEEYRREAKRFPSGRRIALFGHADPVEPPELISPGSWTADQHLLIGEFIRRHHPRIAFEIARNGFPGPKSEKGEPIGLTAERLRDIRALIGLVARSHGIDLRCSVDYLRKRYYGDAVSPRGVHAVYLMAVLRIADFFQLQAGRAEQTRLRTQSLRSSISIKEWKKHGAMLHLGLKHDDPEAIDAELHEQVEPDTYFALRDLFEQVQAELDHTWAALGEVYGLHESDGLNRLSLRTRRVFTNLTHPDFISRLSFLPHRAAFETANRRLLPLLAKPLYGEQPAIAIRELVQNAVDAVLELEEHCRKEGIEASALRDRNRLDADVVVTVNSETGDVTVSDRGIGMTPQTVLDYFLKIGASSRQSDEWVKKFVEPSGHSSVLRSGRFGVGVLASFLLGDRLEVTTRHISAKEGVLFTASLEDSLIPLKPVTGVGIGTSVRIAAGRKGQELADHRRHSDWNYYGLDHPRLLRILEPQHAVLPNNYIPFPGQTDSTDWRETSAPGYDSVLWTEETRSLFCNGIFVSPQWFVPHPSMYDRTDFAGEGDKRIGFAPGLAVFDSDGRLPIALSRGGLVDRDLALEQAVARDILRDYLAFLLLTAPQEPIRLDGSPIPSRRFHSLVWPETGGWDNWFFGPEASTHLDLLGMTGYNAVFFIPGASEDPSLPAKAPALNATLRAGVLTSCYHVQGFKHVKGLYIVPNPWPIVFAGAARNYPPIVGARILLRKENEYANRILKADQESFPYEVEWETGQWVLVRRGTPGEPCVDYRRLLESRDAPDWWILGVEWHFEPWEPQFNDGKFWMEYLRTPWMPLNPDERRRKLAHAFKTLAPYVARWERRAEASVRPGLRNRQLA